jgi:hypothetical protein
MIVGDQDAGCHGQRLPRSGAISLLRCALLLLAFFIAFPNAPSRAAERAPLALDGPAAAEEIGARFEYTLDSGWQLSVDDFVDPGAIELKPLPGPIADFGYTPALIWLELPVVNRTADNASWLFFVHANFTQKIAIYRIAGDGTVTTLLDLDEDTPFSGRPVDNPQMVAPFELAPQEQARLVVAYYSQGASRLSMSIETPQSFAALMQVSDAKSFAFYGVMTVMVVLALVGLAILRKPVFVAYAAYVTSVFVYIAHGDGAAFQYLWPDFPRFNSMASVVAGSAVMVFGGLFVVTFLQTARYHPIMHRVLLVMITCVLVIDVVLWSLDPQLLKRMLVIMISIVTLTYLAASLIAARTRFREVRFYVLSWAAAVIPIGLFTARFAFGVEPSFITSYDAMRLGVMFEALMMGLGIFDHYSYQRRTAMEVTVAHAQRSLALGKRLAVLEEQYARANAIARDREESVKDTVHDLRQPMHALRLSLRQMLGTKGAGRQRVGEVEAALGAMERMVAERLANEPGVVAQPPAASTGAKPL